MGKASCNEGVQTELLSRTGGNTVRIVPSAPSQNVTKLPLTGPMQSLVCHMAAKALQTFTGEENLTKEALDIVPLGKGTMCFQP